MNFEERKSLFQEALNKAVEEYSIGVYAANVVLPNGEVVPMLKMSDTKQKEELMVTTDAEVEEKPSKEDEDKTEK